MIVFVCCNLDCFREPKCWKPDAGMGTEGPVGTKGPACMQRDGRPSLPSRVDDSTRDTSRQSVPVLVPARLDRTALATEVVALAGSVPHCTMYYTQYDWGLAHRAASMVSEECQFDPFQRQQFQQPDVTSQHVISRNTNLYPPPNSTS